jgi:CheY-like chemotaxis protein
MRIAYVEDNPTNLALVERVCGMNRHTVVAYSEGEIALQQLVREKFDLILMDVELAGEISGLQVVRHLRRVGLKTPIVAVTAYAMMGDRERCLEAGCNDYLPKPLPINDLLVMLAKYDAITAAGAKPAPVVEAAPLVAPAQEQRAPAAAGKVEQPVTPAPSVPPVPPAPAAAPVPMPAQPVTASVETPAKPVPEVPPNVVGAVPSPAGPKPGVDIPAGSVPASPSAAGSAEALPLAPRPGLDGAAGPAPASSPGAASAEAPPAVPKPDVDAAAEPLPAVLPSAGNAKAPPAAPQLSADAPAKSDEVAPVKHTP